MQYLTFLRRMPPSGGRGCGVSAPARRVPFRMHEKGPKVHIRGYPPYGTPGRVPAFGWVEGTRMSQPAPTCFLPRQALSLAPGRTAKPHYTVPDRAGPASLPGRGTRGGVADPSPVRRILPERRAQARFGLKAREAMGVVLVGIPKQHAPHPPYVSPGRVPAFGWAEKTRMSVPAPTCFLPRQALSLAPGRAAKPHYSVPDRAGLPSLPGWGTRGGVADPSPVRRILPERRA